MPDAVVYWYVLGRSAESRPFTAFSVFVLIAETTIFACDSIDAASVAETVSEPPAVIVRTEDVVSIQASAWLETLLLASAAPVALVVAPHFALIAKSFVADVHLLVPEVGDDRRRRLGDDREVSGDVDRRVEQVGARRDRPLVGQVRAAEQRVDELEEDVVGRPADGVQRDDRADRVARLAPSSLRSR